MGSLKARGTLAGHRMAWGHLRVFGYDACVSLKRDIGDWELLIGENSTILSSALPAAQVHPAANFFNCILHPSILGDYGVAILIILKHYTTHF